MANRFSRSIPALIVTLLCIVGVELFYNGVGRYLLDSVKDSDSTGDVTENAGESQSDVTKRAEDYSIITERNLFGPPPGEKGADANNTATGPEEIEATTLEVVLMGTIGGDEGGRAIILNKTDRKQELYQVGDTVQGALIKEIRRGKVILTLDGRDEMLDMSEAAQYAGGTSSRPVAANPVASRRRVVVPPPAETAEVADGEQSVKPRVVRPTRRIVRPRAIVESEEVAAETEEPEAEELPPEMMEESQEQESENLENTDQQENQDQENVEQAAEQQ